MFYGTVVWDPWLIVAQIVCLQCLYYLTLGIFLSILVGFRVSNMSLVYFFDYATVNTSTIIGWCVIASISLSSIVGAGFLVFLVERAKKCLDFCATLYIIHLFICIIYGGWPASITWWVVNITGLVMASLLSEYLCMKRELREIPISSSRYRSSKLFSFMMDYLDASIGFLHSDLAISFVRTLPFGYIGFVMLFSDILEILTCPMLLSLLDARL